jgi:thymidine phosphorylase
MKVHVEITPALEPIGAGIGAVMQVREVLRVLQQHEFRPMDLQNKAVFLSAKIIELVGMAKGKAAEKLALETIKSGKAWKKMQEIIKAQGGKHPQQKSEDLTLAKMKKEIKAEKSGKVKTIDLKVLNSVARSLGAPLDLQAGLYLHKKT